MSNKDESIYGTIGWIDLTVPNATEVKDFYSKVTGWKAEPVNVGDYDDYNMVANGEPKAGVCHKKGTNSEIPSQWMVYINVRDLKQSRADCLANGGKLITEIKSAGSMGRYCFIEDPAGAACAIFEPTIT